MPPGETEGPIDFLSRLAYRNGRDNVRYLCGDFGLGYHELRKCAPDAVATIALLGSADPGALRREAFVWSIGSGRFLHKGQELSRLDVNRERLRVCPACVEEDLARWSFRLEARMWRRSDWSILPIRTCAAHGLSLVDTDLVDEEQDTSRTFTRTLPNLRAIHAKACNRPFSPFEEYIKARLTDRSDANWLDRFPLYAAARLCAMIGAVAMRGPQVRPSALSDRELWEANGAGYAIASSGDEAIVEFLDRLLATFRTGRYSWSAHMILGPLYTSIASQKDDSAYEPFTGLVREHFFDTLPLGPEDEVFGKAPDRRRLHSLKTASLEYGMSIKKMRKLIVQFGVVPAAAARTTADRLTFNADSAAPILRDLAKAMTLSDAVAYLRIPRALKRLASEPWFPKPMVAAGTSTLKHYFFRRSDLDAFVADLTACADPALRDEPSLVGISQAAKTSVVTVASVVASVLDRNVRRVGLRSDGFGFEALLVDPSEIGSLLHARRANVLSRDEAARALSTDSTTVNLLLHSGLLEGEVASNHVNNRALTVIRPEELERFKRGYLTFAQASRTFGIEARILKSALAEKGILPALRITRTGVRYYRREEIERHLSQFPIPPSCEEAPAAVAGERTTPT